MLIVCLENIHLRSECEFVQRIAFPEPNHPWYPAVQLGVSEKSSKVSLEVIPGFLDNVWDFSSILLGDLNHRHT